ncbi:hypothetical protein P4O66_013304, partial [Electrophorus voltai]
SPEALGFVSAIGFFAFLMVLIFLYLNNKLSIESAAPRPLEHYRKSKELPGSTRVSSVLNSVKQMVDDIAFTLDDMVFVVSGQITEQRPSAPGASSLQRPSAPGACSLQRPSAPGACSLQRPSAPGASSLQRPSAPGASSLQRPSAPGASSLQRPVATEVTDMLFMLFSLPFILSVPDKGYGEADFQGSSSDSDDEVMGQYQEAVSRSQGLRGGCAGSGVHHHKGYSWGTRRKYCPLVAEYDGYSSEASAEDVCLTAGPGARGPAVYRRHLGSRAERLPPPPSARRAGGREAGRAGGEARGSGGKGPMVSAQLQSSEGDDLCHSMCCSVSLLNCIQRMRRTPPLDELQPPPYQDEDGSPRMSCTPSDLGDAKCDLSRRGSDSPRHGYAKGPPSESSRGADSYLKGYEEDVPSDSTAVLSPEDLSARGSSALLPKSYEPEPLSQYGTLDVVFDYDSCDQRLSVTVTAVTDIPAAKRTGNVSWQVHLVLLPTKKQRAKTGAARGPCPVFTETFRFSHIESEMIGNYAVRFRLYSIRRMKKEKVLGEKVFYLTKLNLQGRMSVPVILEPCCSVAGSESQMTVYDASCSETVSSFPSAGQGTAPEILLGLVYNATTGRLSVEVIKGSHFKNIAANKPPSKYLPIQPCFSRTALHKAFVSLRKEIITGYGLFCCLKHLIGGQVYIIRDTYVKLTLLNSMGQEMSKCKTSICRGQPNPTYKETFVFQVALFQLSDVTLILSVYNKRSMKRKEMIGWISLGLNSSGEEELTHWTQMKESKGQQVCRWHSLLES